MTKGIIISVTILFILFFSAVMLTLLIKGKYSRNKNTDKKLLKEIIGIIDLKANDRFVDLGAGDFRLVFTAAKYSEAYSTGFEMAPLSFFSARIRKLLKFGFNKNIKVSHKNFFNADLSKFNVIYLNLQEDLVTQLLGKFSYELSPHTRIYSYGNKFYGTPIIKEHKLSNGDLIYEYSKQSFKVFDG